MFLFGILCPCPLVARAAAIGSRAYGIPSFSYNCFVYRPQSERPVLAYTRTVSFSTLFYATVDLPFVRAAMLARFALFSFLLFIFARDSRLSLDDSIEHVFVNIEKVTSTERRGNVHFFVQFLKSVFYFCNN